MEESQLGVEKNAVEVVNNRKRSHASRACLNCRKIHAGCGKERPCNRCVASGWQATCRDVPRKKRRSKGQIEADASNGGDGDKGDSELKEESDGKDLSSSSPDELLGSSSPLLSSIIKKQPKPKKTKSNSIENIQQVLRNSNNHINNNGTEVGTTPTQQINTLGIDTPPFRINTTSNSFIEDDPFQRPPADEMFNVGGILNNNISQYIRGIGINPVSPTNNNNLMFGNGNGNGYGINLNTPFAPTPPNPLDADGGFVTRKEYNTVVKEMQLLRDRNLFLEHKILGITNELSASRGRQEQLFSMINTLMRGSDGINPAFTMNNYFTREEGE